MESNEVHLSLPDRKSAARWMYKMAKEHQNEHEFEHEDGWDVLEDDVGALNHGELDDRRQRNGYMPFSSSFSSLVPPSPEQLSDGSFLHNNTLQVRHSIENVDPSLSSFSVSRKRMNMAAPMVQQQLHNPQMAHNAPTGSHYMKHDEIQVPDDGRKKINEGDADVEGGENYPLEVDDEGSNASGRDDANDDGHNNDHTSVDTNGSSMAVSNQETTENSKFGGSRGFQSSTILFDDIIGHKSAKIRLEEVLLPLSLPPELAQSLLTGIRSLSPSILMYGPPGCGKVSLMYA